MKLGVNIKGEGLSRPTYELGGLMVKGSAFLLAQSIDLVLLVQCVKNHPCCRIYLIACLNTFPFDGSTGLIKEALEVPIGGELNAVITRCNQEQQAQG